MLVLVVCCGRAILLDLFDLAVVGVEEVYSVDAWSMPW